MYIFAELILRQWWRGLPLRFELMKAVTMPTLISPAQINTNSGLFSIIRATTSPRFKPAVLIAQLATEEEEISV